MYNPVLKIFVTVADCGSFNKAAESLYLSSTAIMKQMNLFENHIGLQLFNRTPRGVQLTEAGKSLYKDARLMMQRSEEAIENAYRAGAMQRRTIRVGTSALYPCKSLIELWNKINGDHPQFKLKVVPFEDTHTDGVRREWGRTLMCYMGFLIPRCPAATAVFLNWDNIISVSPCPAATVWPLKE